MGPEYTCVLDICLLPKKGYSYVEAQSLYVLINHTYELNLLSGVLSMDLKLSLPFSISAYLEQNLRMNMRIENMERVK